MSLGLWTWNFLLTNLEIFAHIIPCILISKFLQAFHCLPFPFRLGDDEEREFRHRSGDQTPEVTIEDCGAGTEAPWVRGGSSGDRLLP
jgi:hypothetical protein